jgi:hypothetical protein
MRLQLPWTYPKISNRLSSIGQISCATASHHHTGAWIFESFSCIFLVRNFCKTPYVKFDSNLEPLSYLQDVDEKKWVFNLESQESSACKQLWGSEKAGMTTDRVLVHQQWAAHSLCYHHRHKYNPWTGAAGAWHLTPQSNSSPLPISPQSWQTWARVL